MRGAIATALVALAAIATMAACGGSSHFECCLNGAYYSCADQAQFDACFISSPDNTCTREPAKDPSCG